MNNQTLLETAMAQSALELGCAPEDFLADENKVVLSGNPEGSRAYLKLPFTCQLVSYGRNVVASTTPELQEVARDYINRFPIEHCFETPNLHALDDALAPYGQRTCFMAEYFLPDLRRLVPLNCPYPMRTLEKPDFADLYLPEWRNALCADRAECDALCVGAFHGGDLIALAGASADCEDMWQIGIDVLPAYRRQGVRSSPAARCHFTAPPGQTSALSATPSVRGSARRGSS